MAKPRQPCMQAGGQAGEHGHNWKSAMQLPAHVKMSNHAQTVAEELKRTAARCWKELMQRVS